MKGLNIFVFPVLGSFRDLGCHRGNHKCFIEVLREVNKGYIIYRPCVAKVFNKHCCQKVFY